MSPFIVFDRVPAGMSAAWIMPALYASLAVLVLTFLFWPIVLACAARITRAQLAVAGRARQAYRATRVIAGLALAVLIGWLLVVAVLFERRLEPQPIERPVAVAVADPWRRGHFVGAVLVSGLERLADLDATAGAGPRKLWSVLVLLAALLMLYVALHLRPALDERAILMGR